MGVLSVMEAATIAAVGALRVNVELAVTTGVTWTYNTSTPLFDEHGMCVGDEYPDDLICLSFAHSQVAGCDYRLRVSFWDVEGEADFFFVDIGLDPPAIVIELSQDEPEPFFNEIMDLGSVINALANLQTLEDEFHTKVAGEVAATDAKVAYREKRARFTVIDGAKHDS